MDQIIEIRDPEIDQEAIRNLIETQVSQRKLNNAFDPDLPTKGSNSLLQYNNHQNPKMDNVSDWEDTFITLMMHHRIIEPDFTSKSPIIGPLIVTIRRLWNWMSTKWYVRAILSQQNGINTYMVILLTELNKQQQTLANQLTEMQAKVESLEKRITETGNQ